MRTFPSKSWAAVAALTVLVTGATAPADGEPGAEAAIPTGAAKQELDVGGVRLEVFTYKPRGYKDGPLLLVFHGVSRNAEGYRDSARDLADKCGALVVAPLFDEKRFPTRLYQRGGLLTREGKAAPKEQWTWQLVPKLAQAVRRLEGRPEMPCYLLGHSGGGQFLDRLAGFVPTDAVRIVAANPGTHLFPTHDMPYPYGFGGLPDELADDAALRRYLAQPLTIFLGTADTAQGGDLDDSEAAKKQGASRYQRGLNAFRAAEQLARQKGWPFNWRLVEAPDVGHSEKAMFAAPTCETALFGKKGDAQPKP
jgi:poly(3-hydroxybutyrate) depolymerase